MTDELIADVEALFTLTALNVERGFELTENYCMTASPMAQVFWTTVYSNALDAYLETTTDE